MEQQQENEAYTANEFAGAIIAECRYEQTKLDERSIMTKLYQIDN